ncbi:hypothetical protein RPYSC3_47750 [Rhodopseudomonas palustris]|nr:hypothetical protein RPYSC3_47750 [Rhodopseudomonas palustris]
MEIEDFDFATLDKLFGKRLTNREFLTAYKAGKPCKDCGRFFPTYCMDFDHKDPKGKLIKVSRLAWGGREAMLREIRKCDLVCAVCHRIRTFARGLHKGCHLRVQDK